ncbi:MAG: quinone-dependent dihydroorotate dehydrogenase [Alphaproteobacteria bacterium]|nr:quinone-dependent dihydroorotate dehydrogenase [Alphaproteobacteria bacterium]
MLNLYRFVKPAIFKIDPETAHGMTIKALKTGAVRVCKKVTNDALSQNLFGLSFKNPVGLSAGFDKNGEVIEPILNLGFGFTEIGTVTPKPQIGNPKPRIFRDPKTESVINAMGFPNDGLEVFKRNLERFLNSPARSKGVVGINIGMNKDQTDPAADYCLLIEELGQMADYLTVNISSPNTPGLRNLQEKGPLSELLAKLMDTRAKHCPQNPSLLVKLAPDLNETQQEEIAETLLENKVDGVILANTTLDRPDYLPIDFAALKGGLSGAPVRQKSTTIIRNFYRLTSGKLTIIGVGGVSTAEDAYEKIKAGASLVQLYTGMIYQGPNIANNINNGLPKLLKNDGFNTIKDAIGSG